jgi:hypothetical protein
LREFSVFPTSAAGSTDIQHSRPFLHAAFPMRPRGARFAHDLVGQGYMPSTPEDTALYSRVLGRHLGPVGETTPGPVARLLISSSTTARCASNPATTPEARTAIARLRNGSRHCDSSLSATAKP